jgi:hypothetical protein
MQKIKRKKERKETKDRKENKKEKKNLIWLPSTVAKSLLTSLK